MRSTMTEGTDCSTVHGSRELGIFSNSTRATLVAVPALRASRSGASAVTVIDSETAGLSVMVTSELCATPTVMPDLVADPYPDRSAFRLYTPGDRLMNRNKP